MPSLLGNRHPAKSIKNPKFEKMTIRKFQALTLIFTLAASAVFAQTRDTLSELKIGQWQQHLPWRTARYITASETKAYFATEWAVVEVDKQDFQPQFLTKVEGLSDINIQLIRFNKVANRLLIAYSNSNLDIWNPSDGSVVNLPFIKTNIGLQGDKKIYDLFFEGKFAYLACGFGIVKLNLEREEVEYTVFTGAAVRCFSVFQNKFYAGTGEGIFTLPTDNLNPADFGQWHLLDASDGFPADYSAQAMAAFDGSLFFGSGKTLYKFDGAALQTVKTHPTFSVFYLTTEGAGMVIGWKEQYNGEVEYRAAGGQTDQIHWTCEVFKPFYGIEDGSKKFWFADDSEGFRFFDWAKNDCERFVFNSPATSKIAEIALSGERTFIATPGPNSQLGPPYFADGVLIFENGRWSQFSRASNPELQDGDCYADIWRVAPHPSKTDVFYSGSWVGGLIENSAGKVNCFTQNNSILQGAGASGSSRTAIGGLVFDEDENLWISNYDATSPIACLKKDGKLVNFVGAPANNLLQCVVDGNGYKWFVVAFNGGVMVYDSGDDLDSPSDDRYRLITSSNSVLPTNTVNCLVADLDGDVWVGTQQGVVSFECGSNIFDENCKGSRRILNIDDFNGYLLETENVQTAAVDGANRKWFGTTNGVFVIRPSGDGQVEKFTSTNSPLFSNEIADIEVNPANGEVWIGTQNGLQTLRTEATVGGKVNTRTAYAYPNPVRPDYDGPIAIYGLARDANVKITDAAGNLVFEGKSLGGQAIWDGRDYTGRRVATGVYLIFATSAATFDSPDAVIAKVVVVK